MKKSRCTLSFLTSGSDCEKAILGEMDDKGGTEYNSNNNDWCALRRRERVGLFAVA
jgi:hypothetical protein